MGNKIILANEYFKYRKLIEKCEFIERNISDKDLYMKIYKSLDNGHSLSKMINKLRVDVNCYYNFYKKNPDDREYKNIYLSAKKVFDSFNEYRKYINSTRSV